MVLFSSLKKSWLASLVGGERRSDGRSGRRSGARITVNGPNGRNGDRVPHRTGGRPKDFAFHGERHGTGGRVISRSGTTHVRATLANRRIRRHLSACGSRAGYCWIEFHLSPCSTEWPEWCTILEDIHISDGRRLRRCAGAPVHDYKLFGEPASKTGTGGEQRGTTGCRMGTHMSRASKLPASWRSGSSGSAARSASPWRPKRSEREKDDYFSSTSSSPSPRLLAPSAVE